MYIRIFSAWRFGNPIKIVMRKLGKGRVVMRKQRCFHPGCFKARPKTIWSLGDERTTHSHTRAHTENETMARQAKEGAACVETPRCQSAIPESSWVRGKQTWVDTSVVGWEGNKTDDLVCLLRVFWRVGKGGGDFEVFLTPTWKKCNVTFLQWWDWIRRYLKNILGSHLYTRVLTWLMLRICMICTLDADCNYPRTLVSQVRLPPASLNKKVAVFGIHVLPCETNARVASLDRLLLAVGKFREWHGCWVGSPFHICIWAVPVNAWEGQHLALPLGGIPHHSLDCHRNLCENVQSARKCPQRSSEVDGVRLCRDQLLRWSVGIDCKIVCWDQLLRLFV